MKTLIVTRHAHRDILERTDDNGLSAKGQRQAELLSDYFLKHYSAKPDLILSSPRLRCQETLRPLSANLGIDVEIEVLLDEASGQNERMLNRISKFIDWMNTDAPNFVVICSHGDWIPVFFESALGSPVELGKSGIAVIEWTPESIKLKEKLHAF